MKKYSAIIILAPGIIESNKGKLTFNKNGFNFNYEIEGDPHEFRFKAAKKFYLEDKNLEFILVGGTVKDENKETVKVNDKEVLKADVMKDILESRYEISSNSLNPVKSDSNTEGNAMAVKRYLSEKNETYINNIGLLTNFYHLPRAIKTFIDIAHLRLIPICAESIVYKEEFENIKHFYHHEGFSRIINDLKDHDSEIKGMLAQETGSYTPRIK